MYVIVAQIMTGITNVSTEKFIVEENDDVKKIAGVFLSNFATPFINFCGLVKKKDSTYLFTILNTDRSNLPKTHWCSILSNCFCLIAMDLLVVKPSYGFTGGKAFITQGDRKTKRDVNSRLQLIEMFF